jgi:hypothetical protein
VSLSKRAHSGRAANHAPSNRKNAQLGDNRLGSSNDLLGRDGLAGRTLENARHDLEHGFGSTNDVFGGQGFMGRTIEDVRKRAPPPLQLGTVGGKRICVPWC